MTQQHTPSPWAVPNWNQLGRIDVVDSAGGIVAAVYLRDKPREEAANARLIAAAPELLAALRDYLVAEDIYNQAVTRKATTVAGHLVREKRAAAQAAIAKASPQARGRGQEVKP